MKTWQKIGIAVGLGAMIVATIYFSYQYFSIYW